MTERRIHGRHRPTRSIVVGATWRTGSTLLCDLLADTARLGYPKEPFGPTAVGPCAEAWGVDPDDPDAYLRAVLRDGTTPNGVFAVKLMWTHLDRLAATTTGSLVDALRSFPDPSVVLLERDDKVAAAVSQHRAELTGEWSSIRRSGATWQPAADPERISELHDVQHDHTRRWRDLADAAGLPVLHLSYEDLVADPLDAVARVAGLVGVHPPERVRTGLRRQADWWNASVRAAWSATTGGCSECEGATLSVC